MKIFNIDQDISQDDDFNELTSDILVDNNEVGNGAFCSLSTYIQFEIICMLFFLRTIMYLFLFYVT